MDGAGAVIAVPAFNFPGGKPLGDPHLRDFPVWKGASCRIDTPGGSPEHFGGIPKARQTSQLAQKSSPPGHCLVRFRPFGVRPLQPWEKRVS